MKKTRGFKTLSMRIAFIIGATVIIVGASIAAYMQTRIITEIGRHSSLGLQNRLMSTAEECNNAFLDAIYSAAGLKNSVESIFSVDEYKADARNYFDSFIRPSLDGLFYNTIDRSEVIFAAYFAVHPDLAGYPIVNEVFFEDTGAGIEALTPQTYEEYMQIDSEDMQWFYGSYLSGAPHWTSVYEWFDGTVMVSYGVPIIAENATIGIIGVDISIDHIENLVSGVKVYDSGFAFLVDHNGDFFESNDVISRLSAVEKNSLLDSAGISGGEVFEISLGGVVYLATSRQLINDYTVFLLAPKNEVNAEVAASLTRFVIIFITCFAIVMFISYLIAKPVAKPLSILSGFVREAASTGNIILQPEDVEVIDKYSLLKDEIGQIVGDTAALFKHIRDISNALDVMAGGDLTHDMALQSEMDTMGNALHHLFKNLNSIFTEINMSTRQVATGSKQIADGAQSLAQGSTQQAVSVAQLSASISEIADKTKGNAEMAGRAAALAGSIRESAQKGSRQMDEMIQAVKEINQASQNISNVIKVIDEIAFQTNILALNAAVEAARAGQHGKGFAVVAEEVRSLAAKSAEAAKTTEDLIANSIEKAELGSRIAGETAESLSEIAAGIDESNQIVNEIARSSKEQSVSIAHINEGIDQVAQVIQRNSATSEESAAASEEMSSQSALLEGLTSQFKLKG